MTLPPFRQDRSPTLAIALLALVAGCAAEGDDTSGGELPPIDSPTESGESGFDTFVYDTSLGDTGIDGGPKHTLTITHEGEWSMSPNGGPWTSMTGEVHVIELVDGNIDKPNCEVRFALTGQEAIEACPTCSAAFEVLYYVAEGDVEACLDTETPVDGSTVRMGWSDSDDTIWLDYDNSGVWLEWYEGRRVDDSVFFDWETDVGVAIPEEDDA